VGSAKDPNRLRFFQKDSKSRIGAEKRLSDRISLEAKNMWTRIAGFSGALAVGMGAVGAHALPKDRSPEMRAVFQTGSTYHLLHSVVLATCALNMPVSKKKTLVCSLFTAGILLFSGSCYACALANERKPYSYPAPVGGFALISGWILLGAM
jgi:uncharacterized membrane protein YgdD (TMEM256/DUF423 family)